VIITDYSLKKITTIGLGGVCKEYFCPRDLKDIDEFKSKKNKLFIGNGSNICFVTDYYDGFIISLKRLNKKISHDQHYIYCTSNISCTKIARYLYKNRISGFEFLYGIPGTIGGAVYMNAGAFNEEILSYVHSIDTLDSDGKFRTFHNKDLNYSYRFSGLDKELLITSIIFKNHQKIFDENLLENFNFKRKSSQPVNQLSCGCIFKNPKTNFASKLIEDAKLKGTRVGGIYISNKHSNYFINDGSGTHHEFMDLVDIVKDKILHEFDIKLEEEVILIK
tara:strand:+ start:1177 stop:2010 length:834 start_codon:yes stop_codon:yes gene_type:complete